MIEASCLSNLAISSNKKYNIHDVLITAFIDHCQIKNYEKSYKLIKSVKRDYYSWIKEMSREKK